VSESGILSLTLWNGKPLKISLGPMEFERRDELRVAFSDGHLEFGLK